MFRFLAALLLLLRAACAGIVSDVRAAIAQNDFPLAESRLATYRKQHGVTPEMIEALSWLGRGALAARKLDQAETYARQARALALEQLKTRPLDAEPRLPLALGASIEVQARVMAERGQRDQAVRFLRRELKTYWTNSIRARIQKNINLLSLEGKPAPPLEAREWLGAKPPALAALKGRPVLLFFWAHWCPDCKQEAPVLARLKSRFAARGLVLLGPTQRYGYAARGQDAGPAEELKYIDEVRRTSYGELKEMPVPVSEENFKRYGASTTPTLVLIDRAGIVRLYHPGEMSYDDLARRIEALPAR